MVILRLKETGSLLISGNISGKGGKVLAPDYFCHLMPVMYSKSLFIRSSSNWKRYNYLSYKNGEIDNNDLGPFMTICRYLLPGTGSERARKSLHKIVPSVLLTSTATVYNSFVFLQNTQDVVNIKVSDGVKPFFQDTLSAGKGVRELAIDLNKPKDVRIEFEGYVSRMYTVLVLKVKKGLWLTIFRRRGVPVLNSQWSEKKT